MAPCATVISSLSLASRARTFSILACRCLDCVAIWSATCARWLSSWTAIRRGADPIRLLVSSASRNDSTVAGMLWDTMSRSVALILTEASSANDEPTTVKAAARPKARYNRARIVRSQVNEANGPNQPRRSPGRNRDLPKCTVDLFGAKVKQRIRSLPGCHLDQAHNRFEHSVGLQDREEHLIRALIASRSILEYDAAEIEWRPINGID